MLCVCLEVPSNALEWENWAWHSKEQIVNINNAIYSASQLLLGYPISLPVPILLPFTPTPIWLQNNATAHNNFINALNAMGGNFEGHQIDDLDFTNADEVAVWVNLAYNELADASRALGI